MLKLLLNPDDKLIAVRSWWFWRGPYGWEGPTMLIERRGQRQTSTPVWDRALLRWILARFFAPRIATCTLWEYDGASSVVRFKLWRRWYLTHQDLMEAR